MPKNKDDNFAVGKEVHCYAHLVTSPSECKRLFGTEWNKYFVSGLVQSHISLKNPPKRKGKELTALFTIPNGKTKLVTKTVRQLKAGSPPPNTNMILKPHLLACAPVPPRPAPVTVRRKSAPTLPKSPSPSSDYDSILGPPVPAYPDDTPAAFQADLPRPRRVTRAPLSMKDFEMMDGTSDEDDEEPTTV